MFKLNEMKLDIWKLIPRAIFRLQTIFIFSDENYHNTTTTFNQSIW